MNENQKKVCQAIVIAIVAMTLYPPFHFQGLNGVVLNLGYGWLLDPPHYSGTILGSVNIGMLLMQWLGVLIVGAIGFFLFKDR